MKNKKPKFCIKKEMKKLAKGKKQTAASKKRIDEILGNEIGGQQPGTWPHVSRSQGVHPSQVSEGNEMLQKAGLRAHYLPTGEMVTPDARARKDVIKFFGRTDFESFS